MNEEMDNLLVSSPEEKENPESNGTKKRRVLIAFVGFILWFFFQFPLWLTLICLLIIYAVTGGYAYLNVVARTFTRDFKGISRLIKLTIGVRRSQKGNKTIPIIFEENAKKHPDKICFIFEDREWTFREINELSNRVAHVFEEAGFKCGDTVALLMDNRPEYIAMWLGLAKVGIVTALINYNLRDKPLMHSIQIVDAKAIIFGMDFANALEGIRQQLDPLFKMYALDFGNKSEKMPSGVINMDILLKEASSKSLSGPQKSNFNDSVLYIYTSGTTGLPKAAIIRHSKFQIMASGAFHMCGLNKDDCVYVCMPLYHSAGGVLGAGMALVFGCTVAIRKQFSVTNFWTDCNQYKCTVATYIGEMCRYLLAAPARPEDRNHKLRLMFGIGMRPKIWADFVRRFNVERISEFYGSTEGNASLFNIDGKVGAVGFCSVIAPFVQPTALIRISEDTGEPIRGKNGLCIRCKPGESGMFVGKILAQHPMRDFAGYSDLNASQKKVAHNVLVKGDSFFLSGDILSMDELGYLYFKDRTGDTFRWRGENVSTTEVEAVISNAVGLRDCCVYGVQVPNCEGRAGMAAILDPEYDLDLTGLAADLTKILPSYARPLFIRLVGTIDLTGTYKLRKVDYQKEGFDITTIKDPLYIFDSKIARYTPLTAHIHQQLNTGQLRL